MDNIISSMPELLTRASCRKDWKGISAESSLMSPDDPIGQRTEMNELTKRNICVCVGMLLLKLLNIFQF